MKNTISLVLLFLAIGTLSAQTSLYSEDFEGTLSTTTYTSGGASSAWGLNSALSVSGSKSDSAAVSMSDTLFIETASFSTMTYPFVTLEFDQICKIDFFDGGYIQYSIDNGTTWSTATSA